MITPLTSKAVLNIDSYNIEGSFAKLFKMQYCPNIISLVTLVYPPQIFLRIPFFDNIIYFVSLISHETQELTRSNLKRSSNEDQELDPAHKASSTTIAQFPDDVTSLLANGVVYTISDE